MRMRLSWRLAEIRQSSPRLRREIFPFPTGGLLWAAILLTLMPACGLSDERLPAKPHLYPHAVVAADHPLASQAGAEILGQGGNVVDAAVATAFALSVVRPASAGIGGGGFMVIWDAEKQQAVALDYRERAPQKSTPGMFVEAEESKTASSPPSQKGHLAVAVPGHVAGLCYALEHYGTLDLKTVLAPAIRLARDGVPVDEHDLSVQTAALSEFAEHPEYRRRFAALYEKYLNAGRRWKPGDRFYSPQREVLELIAAKGAEAFYQGPVAEALLAESRRGGGLLTAEDLHATAPAVRKALQGQWGEHQIVTMPPPSSGGVALLQSLNMLTAYEQSHPDLTLTKMGRNSPGYAHLLTETLKHAFADRAEYLGDTDFAKVPVDRLISREYAERLAAKIDSDRTHPPGYYGRALPVDDAGTTHFSIIDRQGNAVACTETINTVYGSFVVEPRYGIVLNNQMDDFAAVPGEPNAFGLIQSEANAVAPGKKPLSSMTPTIVLRDGKAVHALGASGGPRIITATLQVLLNLTRFDLPPHEAVAAPRLHHQWLPDVLLLEPPLKPLRKPLEQRGHEVGIRSNLAATQAVSRTEDGVSGGSDPRKHGAPAGY